MKTLFIPAKIQLDSKIDLPKNLPKNIAIAYSIQYKELADKITKELSKSHTIYNIGQVLGCSKPVFAKNTQAIILISDGKFHAINLALETNLPIYIIGQGKTTLISPQEIDKLRQNKKASYVNFLNSNKIGVLISTKPGQQNLKKALEIKKKLNNKKSYFFIANNINIHEFENFPDIQAWINTSCPRLDMNFNKIVNMDEIK